MKFSRRTFLGQISAASLYLRSWFWSSRLIGEPLPEALAGASFSSLYPGQWNTVGRVTPKWLKDSVILQDGFAMTNETWKDCDFRFRARAPQGTEEVQIWAGIRARDRDSRYAFGLRGGNNNDVYLARYAPDGGARFLGVAPLNFHPEPGVWYTLRVLVRGNRFQVYTEGHHLPSINVADEDALWSGGGIAIGGGWLPAEFRDIHVEEFQEDAQKLFDAAGDRVWLPAGFDREQRRVEERKKYTQARIEHFDAPRAEFSLDGKWLFMPVNNLAAGSTPAAVELDDQTWHIMDVRHFWTPTLTWLHAETGFPYLHGVSAGKGISDKLWEVELRRLDNYTFDWKQTRAAWYRHYIDLPQDLSGRRFVLCFDAIAKVAEVWVNGVKVASHIGMFGEVKCDVTAAIRPGRNLLAVYAVGSTDTSDAGKDVVGVAVSVEINESMLDSLPHGMYPGNAAGIWQPVRLIVTKNVAVDDVFVQPRLNGIDCELNITGSDSSAESIEMSYVVRSAKGGAVLYALPSSERMRVRTSASILRFSTPSLAPKLWSPSEPNLYHLEITLTSGDVVLDQLTVPFGFRTFKVENERLLLNGKPFWLRGANHFPHALRPNDKELARRFMQMARDGNVQMTRTHTAPFTETWLNAADEGGVAVSYEGTWPWLMLHGEPPSADLLYDWKQEFASLIRKYRNHPCILIWTVNNEMKFPTLDESKSDLLKRKWTILTGMMKDIRSIDPTRPVICSSSYCRENVAKEYADIIKPNGFDDGDIEDSHQYYGWYNSSFFHLFEGQFGQRFSWPGRPLISQEMSTGYPQNDDGHPTRYYIFVDYTPQSLVGGEAYENRDPAIFLKRQAFITKELAETFRRADRKDCAGILHFAYVSWFKNVWDADSMRPFETYYQLKKALQPVLVSGELYGRHFYAGSTLAFRVCVANDALDGAMLPASQLSWDISYSGSVIARGAKDVPSVPYYTNHWMNIEVQLPTVFSYPRANAMLTLRLESNGITYSENDYALTIGTQRWALEGIKNTQNIALFDPRGQAPKLLRLARHQSVTSMRGLDPRRPLIVTNGGAMQARDISELRHFVEVGGKALILEAGNLLCSMFPGQIDSYRPCEGEIATMALPESPVFEGIEPLDLAWFQPETGTIPRACRGMYRINRNSADVVALAEIVEAHGFLKQPEDVAEVSGSPLLKLRIGNGIVFASDMLLGTADNDPIAGKLLGNLVGALGRNPNV
ncbi:MAG: glycoside hydrolase family 2 protein [Terriglobia bacterium]